MEHILNRWKIRKSTYYDKITIIKTFGMFQIFYNASCIQVPEYVMKEVNKMLFKYLWGSGKERLREEQQLKIWMMVVYKWLILNA